MQKLKETNISTKHWSQLEEGRPVGYFSDYLQIALKHDRGAELGSTENQLQLSGQSRTRTRDLQISTPTP